MVAQIVGVVDVVAALALVGMTSIPWVGDLALKGLGISLVWLICGLFLLTAAPALGLAFLGRFPRVALALGGAFPLLFIIMYVGLTIAFA